MLQGVAVRVVSAFVIGLLSAASTWAVVPKERTTPLSQKEFFRPDLYISTSAVPLADVLARMPNRAAWDSFLQERASNTLGRGTAAHIDPRSGAAASIVGVFPLIPGPGYGNAVTLPEVSARLGRSVSAVDSNVVAELVRRFVVSHAAVLGVDVTQLGEARATLSNPDLWHVRIPQAYRGIPVRHGQLVAAISHGNLVVVGTEGWGNARIDVTTRFTAEQAMDAGFAHIEGRQPEDTIMARPALEVIPYAPADFQQGEGFAGPVGAGYGHRLAWVFRFQRAPELELWEVIVDAQTGEVLALEDKNHYIAKQATGGVYPLTNTEICPTPETCGTMQLGWPMPWLNTGLPAPNDFANSAGVYDYTAGTATSTLVGRYVRINDNCGPISLSSPTGDLNFGGANGQHDCVTPGFGGAGNTPASRSAFYEVNKIKEQARGWLPANTWLTGVLQTNVNIVQTCNAFYSGGTINFYRSGPGGTGFCRNTGEIAAVFDHEWGHGMDDFDTGGVLSASSEGYADIAGIYRLQASCVGHGFNDTTGATACGITADGTGRNRNENQVGGFHCDTDCSGVRDSDWAKHTPNTPDTAANFVCGECSASSGLCGRQTHCAAAPSRQMAWDFVSRDLRGAPFNMSSETAFIVGNKVFYQGSGLIGSWHTCTCPTTSNGCGATNAYLQWLAADDDNGNLTDGTPHMTAIFASMNRHDMACATPAPTNSGCAAGPSVSSTLSGSAGNNTVALNWTAVTGATRYWVFRTEGHNGCNLGKALIAEVTGLTYTDTQVANGRAYSYNVVPAGASSACFGPASNCLTLTPTAVADFSLSCNPTAITVPQGGNGTSACTVQSVLGFTAPVTLSCAGLPAGATCTFNPPTVTPPANGSAPTTLTVAAAVATPTGTTPFTAQAANGANVRTAAMSLTVTPAAVVVVPFALAVDAGGNAVMEPNETAIMAPTWRNNGVAPVALTGATSAFTGPAGAVYTNPDNAATYGTIGIAATGTCTGANCYTVNAAAATRPIQHWDTTILETVTPSATTKTWTLHIGQSFTDVPTSSGFYRFIETILHKNVTGGCAPGQYCPSSSTTRAQMAVFVLVAREPAGFNPPNCVAGAEAFSDMPASSPFCKWVEELFRRGVVSGCGNGQFCTNTPAARDAMAVFVLRTLLSTLNPPNCVAGAEMFADVPASSPFCKWIEELVRRGVVSGCGNGNYCPTANVTREQMAVFLTVTFGLTLYGL